MRALLGAIVANSTFTERRKPLHVCAPSVAKPERYRWRRPTRNSPACRYPDPFGGSSAQVRTIAFQSAINLLSVCLRVSGAVAPSASVMLHMRHHRSLPQVSIGGSLDSEFACNQKSSAIVKRVAPTRSHERYVPAPAIKARTVSASCTWTWRASAASRAFSGTLLTAMENSMFVTTSPKRAQRRSPISS